MIETADHHRRDPDDPPGQEPEEPHGARDCYLVTDASSAHPIELQLKPFTFERSPKSSPGLIQHERMDRCADVVVISL